MLPTTRNAFDLDRFIADCRAALREDMGQKAVREVMAAALSNRGLRDALGEPGRAQVQKLQELNALDADPPGSVDLQTWRMLRDRACVTQDY